MKKDKWYFRALAYLRYEHRNSKMTYTESDIEARAEGLRYQKKARTQLKGA